jgi:putative endonuclease
MSKSGVMYVGMTSGLVKRIYQHRKGMVNGFTRKYKCHLLVFFEETSNVSDAIKREKQIKNWHRDWKLNMVRKFNPQMRDLFDEILK